MTEETLARITLADMRAQQALLILPCRARVSIVGALNRQQADALVSRLLGRLPAGDAAACAPLPAVGEVAPLQAPAERRIPFDSAQAHVLIAGRWRLCLASDAGGAREAWSELQRLQLFLARTACGRVHDRAADPSGPSRAGAEGVARRAGRLCGRRPDARRAEGRQGQPDRRLRLAAGQQPKTAGQRGQHRLVRPAAGLSGHLDEAGGARQRGGHPGGLQAQAAAGADGDGGGGGSTARRASFRYAQ